jgi:transcriptional regulator with XRE-family HTH domain
MVLIIATLILKSQLKQESRCKLVDFGVRLKELRTNAGLTQQQLALQLGLTKTVVSYYELRTRSPSPEILVKLASIFHVSTDYLLGIEHERIVDVSGLTEEEISTISHLVELFKKKQMH